MHFFGRQQTRQPAQRIQGFRPTLEVLEDRTVPSSLAPATSHGSGGDYSSAAAQSTLGGNGGAGATGSTGVAGNTGATGGTGGAGGAGVIASTGGTGGNGGMGGTGGLAGTQAAADEVSARDALFSTYGADFQANSAEAAAFHDQFVGALNGGAAAYVATE